MHENDFDSKNKKNYHVSLYYNISRISRLGKLNKTIHFGMGAVLSM